jgi:general secretion pathway protein K
MIGRLGDWATARRRATCLIRPIRPSAHPPIRPRDGSALIIALWVLLVLAILIGTFAYDMRIESEVTMYARNRYKAEFLARAGVEWARLALVKKVADPGEAGELVLQDGDDEQLAIAALNIGRGVGVSGVKKELGEGGFELSMLPEEGRRNVNKLSDLDWEEILDQANVPEEQWPELIDCFNDWMDEGDAQRLNGAESDDPYYKDRGYKCKNAPLDTVEELLLIKGFDEGVVFGRPAEKPDEQPLLGIAPWLTTWGDGKVNVNTASREVLMTIPDIQAESVDDILERRSGVDGDPNTLDDGIKDLGQIPGLTPAMAERLTVSDRKYVRVTSIGSVNEVHYGVWAILQSEGGRSKPVFWREEQMP